MMPPACVDCAHHRKSFFGKHWCHGYVWRDPVTGRETVIPDLCSSMRASHYSPTVGGPFGFIRGSSALCGPEASLFKAKVAESDPVINALVA